jgi:FkbM family methyltransferase
MIPSGVRSLIRSALLDRIGRNLPDRYTLGYEFFLDRIMNRMEEELRFIGRITEGREVAVDVGANLGLYSYALSKQFRRVIAFEPNSRITAKLRRSRRSNVEIHAAALSSSEGEMDLFVPVVAGVDQSGWASFDRQNLVGADEYRRVAVPVLTLDSLDLPTVSFIKIDVEGHELSVLAGAIDTMRRCRPDVLIEVKEASETEVFDYFEALDYDRYRMRAGQLVRHTRGDEEYRGENYVFRARTSPPPIQYAGA